jgi:ADP-ribose pyrophosphatase YjhB (NUDIX family)
MPVRVYFDHYHLLITADIADIKKDVYQLIISNEDKVFDFRLNPEELFNGDKGNIAIITPFVEETLESIFDFADGIIAAGGIVQNENNEVLCIFRRGFWDLPKGKVEKGEKIIDAAQREVKEETGIDTQIENPDAIISFHCYVLNNKNCIKETHWFDMKLNGTNKATPQTEEDISELKWMSKEAYNATRGLFYPLIAAILDQHFGKQ